MRKLWAIILASALAFTLLPRTAFAAQTQAIIASADGIAKGDRVYLGQHGQEHVTWIALDDDGFLLSEYTIGEVIFRDCAQYTQNGNQRHGYYGENDEYAVDDSKLKLAMEGLYNGEGTALFTPLEQSAVAATTLTGESMDWDGKVRSLTAYLYPLSYMEIYDYRLRKYVIDESLLKTGDISDKAGGYEYGWWTRTNDPLQRVVREGGSDQSEPTTDDYRNNYPNYGPPLRGIRPAFHLDTSDTSIVLFASAANNSGHSEGFAAPAAYSAGEWKLTLKDGNSFATGTELTAGDTALLVGNTAKTLTFTHAALSSFTGAGYTNVTAALTNAAGEIIYYGSVNSDADATSSTLPIPAGLSEGAYTLSLYGEDWNGANSTDYATGTPFTLTVSVTTPVVSAVAVTNGTGGGDCLQGETVTITADAAPAGQRFREWLISPSNVTFTEGGTTTATAKFTMPASAVTATAIYEIDTPAQSVPAITDPAANKTVTAVVKSTATLSVTATDATGYQWWINRGKGFIPIPCATSASYTTSPVTAANNGYRYYCIVTGADGSVTSHTFTLDVVSPAYAPQTGDDTHPAVLLGVVLIMGAMLTAYAAFRRRNIR